MTKTTKFCTLKKIRKFPPTSKKTKTMKMEVGIVSRENMKPSSSTPSHLTTFKLSILDQLVLASYAPIILYTFP
ncbi:hypothetical protein CFP56_017978 [Quercus suber]|uniref:Uncharacterized protein n=1 Tax=Quercus suber TaxID=58331 RepID=A0AAW0KJY1_QUESU